MNPDVLDLPDTASTFATIGVHSGRADVGEDADVWPEQRRKGVSQGGAPNGRTLATCLGEVDRSIQRLALLQEDWDSYGGAVIAPEAIANARRLVQELARIDGVPAPAVGGTPDGEVGLAWDVGDWSLDLKIEGSGVLHYVYLDEGDSSMDVERSTKNIGVIANYFLTQLPRR